MRETNPLNSESSELRGKNPLNSESSELRGKNALHSERLMIFFRIKGKKSPKF